MQRRPPFVVGLAVALSASLLPAGAGTAGQFDPSLSTQWGLRIGAEAA